MGELFSSLLLPMAVGAVASTVPDDAQMKVTLGSVIGSLIVGIIATLSLPLGAALGIYLNVSKKFVAIVMAFGAGALIQALAVELAFGSAEHLIVTEKDYIPGPEAPMTPTGRHTAWMVKDLNLFRERMKALGVEYRELKGIISSDQLFVKDPEGHTWEFQEPK